VSWWTANYARYADDFIVTECAQALAEALDDFQRTEDSALALWPVVGIL
jgi:hypothetical protein